MKRVLKWLAIGLPVLFIAIQFIRPERTNPPIDPERTLEKHVTIPDDIKTMIKTACNDCHSHETVWPWYSEIAPISWLVAHDVNEGRRHLNFSDWKKYNAHRQVEKLNEMAGEVRSEKMPMPIYLITHGDARWTKEDRKKFQNWAEDAADALSENLPDEDK
ncbi:MAG TPA: heme-binding domain-containing protein [bacterium]|nr:heme-binding domain-containing protein [bacterium]HMW32102.1 heme-binding domain-containing protein [bacterium]HMY34784.1 heme-binding domain-containing protein [bacterium]HMZ03880.1 heme-binding domain-containing protein [bacterium]HNB08543.1 heme-binding domain-containing protein [bacterium]